MKNEAVVTNQMDCDPFKNWKDLIRDTGDAQVLLVQKKVSR